MAEYLQLAGPERPFVTARSAYFRAGARAVQFESTTGTFGPIRRRIGRALRNQRISRGLNKIRNLSCEECPGLELLEEIRQAWGNTGFSAAPEFLQAAVHIVDRRDLNVLECGSGLTTLLCAVWGERLDAKFWVLEHDPKWKDQISGWLSKAGVENSNLLLAPLRRFGAFEWYEIDRLDLPTSFDVVICDGPPESSVGGRYGLFPLMAGRFRSGTRVLLDDVHREKGQQVLRSWRSDFKMISDVQVNPTGRFAVMTIG